MTAPLETTARAEPTTAASPVGVLALKSLLAPADLTFDGAFPEAGWHRCDDQQTSRNLERFRQEYKVTSSIGSVYHFGSACGSADQTARVDQYAWLAESEAVAGELEDGVYAASYLANLQAEQKSNIKLLQSGATFVGTVAVDSAVGKREFVTEIVGLDGPIVAYMRILTAAPLSDGDYRGIADAYLSHVSESKGP